MVKSNQIKFIMVISNLQQQLFCRSFLMQLEFADIRRKRKHTN